jgi:hypothetical protein
MAFLFFVPNHAHAITRSKVIDRAKDWVEKKVPYSQSRYHEGYRTDCSGFVSMCWDVGKSYTTRTFDECSKRIKRSELRQGDAVLRPGRHVVLFDRWVDKSEGTFYAYEEPSSGKTAQRKIKSLLPGMVFIRGDKVVDDPEPFVISPQQEKLMRLEKQEFENRPVEIVLEPEDVFIPTFERLLGPAPILVP